MSEVEKRADLFSVIMGANGDIAIDLHKRKWNPLIQVWIAHSLVFCDRGCLIIAVQTLQGKFPMKVLLQASFNLHEGCVPHAGSTFTET